MGEVMGSDTFTLKLERNSETGKVRYRSKEDAQEAATLFRIEMELLMNRFQVEDWSRHTEFQMPYHDKEFDSTSYIDAY
jgi:hypothetical protein